MWQCPGLTGKSTLSSCFSDSLGCTWGITTPKRFLWLSHGVTELGTWVNLTALEGVVEVTDGRWWGWRKFKQTKIENEFYLHDEHKEIGKVVQESGFLLSSPSSLLLFGIYYRVFLCTLLTIRNKYIYSKVAGDLPLVRAVAIQPVVWKTHHRCHLFMKLCSHILQKYVFFIICTLLISPSWTFLNFHP